MKFSAMTRRLTFVLVSLVFGLAATPAFAQQVKRLVIVKVDGLPGHFIDQVVREKDALTGKSILPWVEEIFYKNGTRVPNFYTRGLSLSGPAWGQVDSGQHMQIKGNVEFDRYTLRAYDYLNFLPYYVGYALKKKADMPAVEVMDQLEIPIFVDAFDYQKRYVSHQLFQRGNNWEVLASGFVKLYPGNAKDFVDEWTMGLDMRKITVDQNERDIVGKLTKRPEIDYFDYYDGAFDHVSHHNNDLLSRINTLKDLDRTLGRFWTAIQASSRANETAIVLVSDHGFNSDPRMYSQGFNLVRLLGGRQGGGHHVVTKRRLMLDYSVKGLYPFVPAIKTPSEDSYYLRGRSNDYPTVLVDFDGNERSSIHLRNSDLNTLQILFEQMRGGDLPRETRKAAEEVFFEVIENHRAEWRKIANDLGEEMDALDQSIARAKKKPERQKTFTPEEYARGLDKEAMRTYALEQLDVDVDAEMRRYLKTLTTLMNLRSEKFDPKKYESTELFAPGAMGELNSIFQLQNYVVGPGVEGLVLGADKRLDMGRSFVRINYFDLLAGQRVRNNVQKGVSNRPIDFVAARVPRECIEDALGPDEPISDDAAWMTSGDKQALVVTRKNENGGSSFRYLPISGLAEDGSGKCTFTRKPFTSDLPLRYLEDPNLKIPEGSRETWLAGWHSEREWLEAVHKTEYSNGILGITEQLDSHPVTDPTAVLTPEEKLIKRFRQRQRNLVEADLLILASNHWNFDVRGFNPGGNHGSFFRVSTNSTFMIAGGGPQTGIPRGLTVERPYDSMSLVPTLFRLLGKVDANNEPNEDLRKKGFTRFPGSVIEEVVAPGK